MKNKNKNWLSFEIKVCSISNDYKSKSIKSNKRMVINDIEYNYIKKKLNQEYGIKDEFNELDEEVNKIINEKV
tara:strand:+ start:443 stop:661 length:219 start_codon:yes stop_codon:yes gene_type:complete